MWALKKLTGACTLPYSEVFGSHLDIHTGGADLAFPHHENEIAQSEVFHQCQQWGNYFLHSGKQTGGGGANFFSSCVSSACWRHIDLLAGQWVS